MRRQFDKYKVDSLYIENLIGTAINELKCMVNINGEQVHTYHNLSIVKNHIDKYHNIKITREYNKLFSRLYTDKANSYERYKGNNFTFIPSVNKGSILLKSVQKLFNFEK